MDNLVKFLSKLDSTSFLKIWSKILIEKSPPPKIGKKLKIYEKWDFYVIRKAISSSAFWYYFYGAFIFGLKNNWK